MTSWEGRDLGRLTQEDRNRADAENRFDELKNQWGWLKRSQWMARLVALVYNWWGIFTRMGTGGHAQRTEQAPEVKLEMTSVHGKAKKMAKLLSGMSEYLHRVLASATQLDGKARWSTLLRRIFWYFYGGSPPIGELDQPATGGVTAEFRMISSCSRTL